MSLSRDEVAAPTDAEEATVTAHSCTPERTVFTERGNSEAWIATDLAVDVER